MIKKILLVLAGVIIILVLWNLETIVYGIKQAKGQLYIIRNARPVADYLTDPNVPDSVKQKLRFIQDVREYAVAELGLNNSDNYTSMYDQQGKPVLWVVTGCRPFAFEPKEWHFPFVGTMPYKGFFVEEDAYEAKEELKEAGYDAGVRTVEGWSTLGWFNDPILSNMLYRSTGELANLIIHELVHATIFVKDSVKFNENLATFIGDKGTFLFLEHRFGKDSDVYRDYVMEMKDEQNYIKHILRGADSLEVLYQSFNKLMPVAKKERKKRKMIDRIMNTLDTVDFYNPGYWQGQEGHMPDNTFFMSFMRYRSKQDVLEKQYREEFKGHLPGYIKYLKRKYR